MLTRKNDKYEFDIERCVQCGGCLAACPNKALDALLLKNGLYFIKWNKDKCVDCSKCVDVCPANILPTRKLLEISNAKSTWLVHAKDEAVRSSASSGGAGRVLFKTALDEGIVSVGYSLKKKIGFPWVEGACWGSGDSLDAMPTSIYHPVLFLQNFEISKNNKSLVVIGCPCQLEGISKLVGNRQKIVKIAIYCKQQKHLGLVRFVSKMLNTQFNIESQESPVRWRGEGWPGVMRLGDNSLPYEKMAALPFGKNLWRVPGCKFCPNPYGTDVDLTLSDPWGIESNHSGKTVVVAWTKQGEDLLNAAGNNSIIQSLTENESQLAFNSVDEKNNALLTEYYAKEPHNSLRLKCAGRAEEFQIKLLESILDRYALPHLFLRVIARCPNFRDIFLKSIS